jgi:hypothetical protein
VQYGRELQKATMGLATFTLIHILGVGVISLLILAVTFFALYVRNFPVGGREKAITALAPFI